MGAQRDMRVDGLRGVAALTVLLPQSALLLSEGATDNARDAAVLGFSLLFVVSGYLLYLPFVLTVVRHDLRVDLRAYARNRVLRLLPPVLLVLAAGWALGVPAFADPALLVPLPVFAVLLPALGRLARRLDDGERRIRAVVVPAALLLAFGVAGLVLGSPLGHAVPFALGMAAAASSVGMTGRRTHRRKVWKVRRGALVALCLALLGTAPSSLARYEPTVLSVALAATIVVLRLPGQGIRRYLAAMFESGPLRRAGVVSTGLVLWHVPLALALRSRGPSLETLEDYLGGFGIVLAGSWVLAELTRWLVEEPSLRAHRPELLRVRRSEVVLKLAPEIALPAQRAPQPAPIVVSLPPTGGKHRAEVTGA